MQQRTVLICGAGPTGLMLALWLTRSGIPVRIIDAASGPGTTSRATVVHARTLEFYRQLGLDTALLANGVELKYGNLWVAGKRAARLPFGDAGAAVSPYPYILSFPQDQHETLLVDALGALDVTVERNTTLLSFEETEAGIRARLQTGSGREELADAAYLAGCDGAHSAVRHQLGIGFPGGTYENLFYVADLRIRGALADGELHAAMDEADFVLIFPMRGEGRVRMVGALKPGAAAKTELQWSDVSDAILRRLGLQVEAVHWFSTYHVHHRVADRFRKGRAFLLGDAGHIHSPVGGQGMNTGIGDAVNLAWKLAAVLKEGAPEALLDTYETERRAFARQLVATTDRVFTFIDRRSTLATFIRNHLAAPFVGTAFRFPAVRAGAFRTLSQTGIEYRSSALSTGEAGRIQGGDRLPWVLQDVAVIGERDNFAPLSCLCWQVHCYGVPAPGLQALCRARNLPLCVFSPDARASRAGLKQDAIYLVRPDGYVGLAVPSGNAAALTAYLDRWSIGSGA